MIETYKIISAAIGVPMIIWGLSGLMKKTDKQLKEKVPMLDRGIEE